MCVLIYDPLHTPMLAPFVLSRACPELVEGSKDAVLQRLSDIPQGYIRVSMSQTVPGKTRKDEILNQVQDDRIENSNGIAVLP